MANEKDLHDCLSPWCSSFCMSLHGRTDSRADAVRSFLIPVLVELVMAYDSWVLPFELPAMLDDEHACDAIEESKWRPDPSPEIPVLWRTGHPSEVLRDLHVRFRDTQGRLIGLSSTSARRRLHQCGPNLQRLLPDHIPWTCCGPRDGDPLCCGRYVDCTKPSVGAVSIVHDAWRQSRGVIVLRDGMWKMCSATEVVPGDIMCVRGGDLLCADMRVLFSEDLCVNLEVLTGERLGRKRTVVDTNSYLWVEEATNLLFSDSCVRSGHGIALVLRTGYSTLISMLFGKDAERNRETALSRSLMSLRSQHGLMFNPDQGTLWPVSTVEDLAKSEIFLATIPAIPSRHVLHFMSSHFKFCMLLVPAVVFGRVFANDVNASEDSIDGSMLYAWRDVLTLEDALAAHYTARRTRRGPVVAVAVSGPHNVRILRLLQGEDRTPRVTHFMSGEAFPDHDMDERIRASLAIVDGSTATDTVIACSRAVVFPTMTLQQPHRLEWLPEYCRATKLVLSMSGFRCLVQ